MSVNRVAEGSWESECRGKYLFNDGGDICVFLRGGAGFGAGFFDMGDDFIVGENGGLGFEDLGSMHIRYVQ